MTWPSANLPVEAPLSTLEKKPTRIAWVLKVSTETSGLGFESRFEIPVFRATQEIGLDPKPS